VLGQDAPRFLSGCYLLGMASVHCVFSVGNAELHRAMLKPIESQRKRTFRKLRMTPQLMNVQLHPSKLHTAD
jgi:hypothetical protein